MVTLLLLLLACSAPPPDDPGLVQLGAAMRAWDGAKVALDAGRWDEALAGVDAALALRPSDSLLQAWRGRVLLAAGRTAEARALLDTVVHDHPAMHGARADRALALARLGDVAAGAEDLKLLLQAGVTTPRALVRDPDWQAFRGDPALSFLPSTALELVVAVPRSLSYVGSEVTVRADLVGVGAGPLAVEVTAVSGPLVLSRVVEDDISAPDGDRVRRLSWAFRLTGPGHVDLSGWTVTQGAERVTAEGGAFDVAGPTEAIALPGALPRSLPVPSSLGDAGAVPPWAGAAKAPWLSDGGVIVAVRAGQQLVLADRAHHRPAWTSVLRKDGVNQAELSAFDEAPGPLTVLERGALVWSYDEAGSR
jgi:hypothetical protein